MRPKDSLFTRLKSLKPDKNALWLVAFAALTILSIVLFFISKPWILKILFLLITIGVVIYCWLLFESRRIMPKSAHKGSTPPLSPEPLASETESEKPKTPEAESIVEEGDQPVEQEEHLVFVSEKGNKYHLDRNCFGLRLADSIQEMTEEKAISLNRKPCSKCGQKAKEG